MTGAVPVVRTAELMTGICFTMQPGTMERVSRNLGAIRDFTAAPDVLLVDMANA